jgi:hypothetical protein
MSLLNAIDPTHMSIQERRAEVASILALGLIRLRTPRPSATEGREAAGLAFCPPQSVHTNPSTRVRNAVRAALLARQKGV